MSPLYCVGAARLFNGNCLDVLRAMPSSSVDCIVTDPPYELKFMEAGWDSSGIAFNVELWAECLRVVKPGGYLLAFGGTRTFHRLVSAIEDAGFQIRDRFRFDCDAKAKYEALWESLTPDQRQAVAELLNDQVDFGSETAWVYGSGFPKSELWSRAKAAAGNLEAQRMIAAGFEGWARGGLKPAYEPICIARKRLAGTVSENVLAHGTGALNVDACRIADGDGDSDLHSGRWPANFAHDGSLDVHFPDSDNGTGPNRPMERAHDSGRGLANSGVVGFKMKPGARRRDAGSASRFFYCAKTSRADRHDGLGDIKPQFAHGSTLRDAENLKDRSGNFHPTVKPTDLMAYLCRLFTPPGGRVLDPFMGSGSTGKACVWEGFSFDGIEIEKEHVEIAYARIKNAVRREEPAPIQRSLFDVAA